MERTMVKNSPKAFDSTTQTSSELLPSLVRNGKPISEEDHNNILTQMCLTISEFKGDKEAFMSGVITRYVETLARSKMHVLGFPANLDFDYGALAPLLQFLINNIGDPFTGSCYIFNSRPFELSILDWFAQLWEIEKNEYWGYITTGGTEGNLHGILVGRELYPDGILYTSQESHDSIFKVARMYRMKCVQVASLVSGEIDCDDLKASLLAHKDKPAIININIGTTMKGAIDDLDLVIQTLEQSGFTPNRFYIHCDAALLGIMLPLLQGAPRFTFKKPIGSITISGHKFVGCPFPCGVAMTRLEHIKVLSINVEYIATMDATITGSRDGHTPIFLWYTISKKGFEGLQKEVENCIMNANYLKEQLRNAGISVMLNDFSITVVFERPQDDGFARRWNLACKGNIARVVVMQHVTIEMIDSFVKELVQKRSVWYQDGKNHPPCFADDIGAPNCTCTLHK